MTIQEVGPARRRAPRMPIAAMSPHVRSRLINVAILYPNTPAGRFDTAYYLERHMPMSIELLRSHPGYRGVSVEIAIGGAAPGTDAAYIAMCQYRFESIDDFVEAFTPHQETLQGDMGAYTNIEPVIQFNEIEIAA